LRDEDPFSSNSVFLAHIKLFPEKRQLESENGEEVWVLAIMVSVSSKLVTLILFIAAISLSGSIVCH
jgi:hypothetical protein